MEGLQLSLCLRVRRRNIHGGFYAMYFVFAIRLVHMLFLIRVHFVFRTVYRKPVPLIFDYWIQAMLPIVARLAA